MLEVKELEQIKKKLTESKKEVESQLRKFADKDKKVKGNFQTRYPDYGEEMQDSAEEVSDYDRTLPVEHQLETELAKIERALEKINDGNNFGLCEKCGKEIEKERIMVNPQAAHCLECAEKRQ